MDVFECPVVGCVGVPVGASVLAVLTVDDSVISGPKVGG